MTLACVKLMRTESAQIPLKFSFIEVTFEFLLCAIHSESKRVKGIQHEFTCHGLAYSCRLTSQAQDFCTWRGELTMFITEYHLDSSTLSNKH